ncbi:cupin-like domain containing protein [Nitzschia inconspicua]|uniref:Cupin-like domain containing protein n=1 Tax=Nitzschia inconspicua TaxID=303405 RepID=A0A9K3LG70_9STRA|nr:cupin-like domain containing protein [Nitzschia inconspicua]
MSRDVKRNSNVLESSGEEEILSSSKKLKESSQTKNEKDSSDFSTGRQSGQPSFPNEYAGYSFQHDTSITTIDTLDLNSVCAETFFDRYIRKRKPCILNGLPPSGGKNKDDVPLNISRKLLEDLAGTKTIQVERRFNRTENFGQNRTAKRQVQLSISDFLKALLDHTDGDSTSTNTTKENELYYWSTQEDTDDPYNIPCRQLLDHGHIPENVPIAGNLILSSCNLWMGSSEDGASSGLHHDYHDNFYLLLQGTKRFRLFSPDCAPMLHVYGTIHHIYPNGRISYVGSEAREDGVPLDELKRVNDNNPQSDEDEEDDDEEEIVIGKGFDYVSDEEEDDTEFDENDQTDDFDEIMGVRTAGEGDELEEVNGSKIPHQGTVDDTHPDSFSVINPCEANQDALFKKFPEYKSCRQIVVELKAGQILYLPAGFFHEVTSYSNTNDSVQTNDMGNCHMALNYWYHPPDALGESDFGSPYKDDFWKKAP